MKISIPETWIDWLNVETFGWVRRIDIIMVVLFAASVGWGWYASGWRGAVIGALGFILMGIYAYWSSPLEDK